MKIYLFLKESFKYKFVSDSAITLVSHAVVAISGLAINTLVGNYYKAEGLGILNQSLSIFLILTVFANFGIQTSTQKYAAQFSSDYNQLKVVFSSAVYTTAVTSISLVLLFLLITNLIDDFYSSIGVKEITEILIISVPIFSINKTLNNFEAGIRSMKVYSIVRSLRWMIVLFLILYLSISKMPLTFIGYSFLVSELLICLFLIFLRRNYFFKLDLQWAKEHLIFGSKSIIMEVVASFNTRVPILIIGFYLGDMVAGYYSYVETFAFSVMLLSGALQKNFNSLYTRLWYQNKLEEIRNRISKLFKINSLLALPVFIGAFLFYYLYTNFTMPIEYLDHKWLMCILLFSILINYLLAPFSTLLMMSNYLNENIFRVSLILTLNILFTILFIPDFNLYAVPAALFITSIFDFIVIQFLYRRKIDINLLEILFLKRMK